MLLCVSLGGWHGIWGPEIFSWYQAMWFASRENISLEIITNGYFSHEGEFSAGK